MTMATDFVDPAVFAANIRKLLADDVRRYRLFGVYWFFIKALLRRFYDRHNLPFLAGTYEDPTVNERIPPGQNVYEMMSAAAAEYQHNASFAVGSRELTDPDGEFFTLQDPDVDG